MTLASTPAMHTLITGSRSRTLWLATCCLVLAACGGGNSSQDQIRIGSGQTPNTGTTGSVDFPIFYVKRVTPDATKTAMGNLDDVRRLRVFNTNADLYMRDRASPSAAVAATWLRVGAAMNRFCCRIWVRRSTSSGSTIQPMRQPVMQ